MPGGAAPSLAQLQQSIGAGLAPPGMPAAPLSLGPATLGVSACNPRCYGLQPLAPLSLGQPAPTLPGMGAHQPMSAQQQLSLAQQYEQYASTIPTTCSRPVRLRQPRAATGLPVGATRTRTL